MVMEMRNGWFDEWGDIFHHTTSVEDYVKSVDEGAYAHFTDVPDIGK